MPLNHCGSLSEAGSLSLRIDGHCDTVTALKNQKAKHIDLENIERFVDLQFFALYIKNESDTDQAVAENNKYYDYYSQLLQKYKKIKPILTKADLNNIGLGEVGSLLAIENSEPLSEDSEALSRLVAKGYRSFGITWSNDNSLAGGANTDTGLKKLGKDVLKAMNHCPVVVDLAHMNRQSFFDSLDILEKSPAVTHSCCYSLCHHKRNLADDALKSLTEADGILGITLVRSFLQDDNLATLDRVIDHIIYAANIMGLDKVALGSDFDGTDLPLDIQNQADLDNLWQLMKSRSFTDQEIALVRGGNWQRFLAKTLGDGADYEI